MRLLCVNSARAKHSEELRKSGTMKHNQEAFSDIICLEVWNRVKTHESGINESS